MKTGDKIKVRVIGVDKARNRISLSARTKPRGEGRAPARPNEHARPSNGYPGRAGARPSRPSGFVCNPFANL